MIITFDFFFLFFFFKLRILCMKSTTLSKIFFFFWEFVKNNLMYIHTYKLIILRIFYSLTHLG